MSNYMYHPRMMRKHESLQKHVRIISKTSEILLVARRGHESYSLATRQAYQEVYRKYWAGLVSFESRRRTLESTAVYEYATDRLYTLIVIYNPLKSLVHHTSTMTVRTSPANPSVCVLQEAISSLLHSGNVLCRGEAVCHSDTKGRVGVVAAGLIVRDEHLHALLEHVRRCEVNITDGSAVFSYSLLIQPISKVVLGEAAAKCSKKPRQRPC